MSIRTLLPLIAALVIMTIPASEATYSKYYKPYHSWYKYKCYVPGCDSCEAYEPYKCSQCATGYAPLADGTCGCAAGYGSWANPAVANFPWNKPVCPKFSSKTKSYSLATRTTSGTYKWVDTHTYYHDKPDICKYKYYADNKCQDSPKPGYGYCACSQCPVGYTSKGGASIADSVCVPTGGGNGTTTGRCKGQPPAVDNANPWRKPCNNKKEGLSCYTGCKPGFKPSPRVIATCAKGGVWTLTGECVSSQGGPACPGVPETGADAQAWGADCKDGAAGKTCTAACADGFTGEATATCQAGGAGWSVESTCVASGDVVCAGPPDVSFDENANPFTDCTDGKLEDACQTGCVDGFIGGYDALCTEGGWDVLGECTQDYGYGGDVVCAGEPAPVEDGSAELPWAESDASTASGVCADGILDDTCFVNCNEADGFTGDGITAFCTDAGWEIDNTCTQAKKNKN